MRPPAQRFRAGRLAERGKEASFGRPWHGAVLDMHGRLPYLSAQSNATNRSVRLTFPEQPIALPGPGF